MPVQSKLAAWNGEGRSLQQLVSFCYDLWTENKSCLKKFFSDNDISTVFKSDTDLCEIARSAHFTSVESIGRFKILKSTSKGASFTQKSLYDDFRPPRSTELVEIRVFQKGPPGPAKSSARWPDMLFSLKLVWVPPLGSPGACFRPSYPP